MQQCQLSDECKIVLFHFGLSFTNKIQKQTSLGQYIQRKSSSKQHMTITTRKITRVQYLCHRETKK